MTISVCMATYNGEKYIEEQLRCIWEQTLKPDEVVICDDGSSDSTVRLIEEFIDKKHLRGQWKLYRNQENKGYPANFYYACSLCTMEVVFLADQDDIWDAEKIERMSGVLKEKKETEAICCKYGLIDARGQEIHTMLKPTRSRGSGRLRKVSIDDIFYKNEWSGMAVAYRRDWYESWSTEDYAIPHDILICARAAEEGAFLQLDEELVFHRRHDNNAAKEEHRVSRLLKKERKLKEIVEYLRFLNAFYDEKVLITGQGVEALQKKRASLQGRYDALQSGSFCAVIKNAWKNRETVRMATVLCDIVIVKK